MQVNASRLLGITQFRQQAAAIMEEVATGKSYHLMRDGEVIGHIVPPNALLISNDSVEFGLLSRVVVPTAERFAREVMESGYLGHVGDDVGRIFAWLWNCDPATAVRWVTYYAAHFIRALRDERYSRPAFSQLWFALAQGLGVSLRTAEIDEFEAFLRTEMPGWDPDGLFSQAELAGGPRPREADDPWPDTLQGGHRGYAKRRWCHLEVNQFIPNPHNGHQLPNSEQWCRIDTISGSTATLIQSDGKALSAQIDDAATWVPVINHEPFYWKAR
ncbi:hypothetical protein [Mycolicibacterium llatzerense]|uniref:hypothetical protein n=1 Tax=Mycolicibacterium llatzerense TaxID=280871 RepID=UPI0031CDEDF3